MSQRKEQEITLEGETLRLLPERAVYWEREQSLFIADIHLGKAATFRRFGFPLPHGSTAEDLHSMTKVLALFSVRVLYILGDFFHSKSGRVEKILEEISEWRRTHGDLRICLIQGNHDKHAGAFPEEWRFEAIDTSHSLPPFILSHFPDDQAKRGLLCGHLHPVCQLREGRMKFERCPCFVREGTNLVLPAFGSFTGGTKLSPIPGRTLYPIIDEAVFSFSLESSH